MILHFRARLACRLSSVRLSNSHLPQRRQRCSTAWSAERRRSRPCARPSAWPRALGRDPWSAPIEGAAASAPAHSLRGVLSEAQFGAFCALINPTIKPHEVAVLLAAMAPGGARQACPKVTRHNPLQWAVTAHTLSAIYVFDASPVAQVTFSSCAATLAAELARMAKQDESGPAV